MLDALLKKEISFRYRGSDLTFQTAQDLFSSHEVDTGTRLLLRALEGCGFDDGTTVLDLGCGYGPIGLSLMKASGAGSVHLVDRDAMAVAYARRNAELNGLCEARVYGSLDYGSVEASRFDLIASNIPAKAGAEAQTMLMRRARSFVKPEGIVAVVVVRAVEHVVRRFLDASPDVELLSEATRARHAVFLYRYIGWFRQPSERASEGFDHAAYRRGRADLRLDGRSLAVETVHGIPEFDSLGYHTELLVRHVADMERRPIENAMVYNVGQGHAALAAAAAMAPGELTLVDRDLLGLRVAERNLSLNRVEGGEVSLLHTVGLPADTDATYDLIVGSLVRIETHASLALSMVRAAGLLSPGGRMLLSGESAIVTRAARALAASRGVRIRRRIKRKGFGLIEAEAS